MHNSIEQRVVKIAHLDENHRNIVVAGAPWGIATNTFGGWMVESFDAHVFAHARTLRAVRRIVAVSTRSCLQ
jgi:hypothetical protein